MIEQIRQISHNGEFRSYAAARLLTRVGSSGLALTLGYELYNETHSKWALGVLGLVESIPVILVALIGGHLADRRDRRQMAVWSQLLQVVSAVGLATTLAKGLNLPVVYSLAFVYSLVGGFAWPALGAMEMEIIPPEEYARAIGVLGSFSAITSLISPVLFGQIIASLGSVVSMGACAVAFFGGLLALLRIKRRGAPVQSDSEEVNLRQSITEGLRFVFHRKPLVGSMALDLFAVLFGGLIAMLPVYASDILKVGPAGLGLLRAAPSLGVSVVMAWCAVRPPLQRAGRNLLGTVALFGVAIIAFGLSRNLVFSLAMLFLSGGFDAVSMVIRSAIVQHFTPNEMRGRVSSIENIFISGSNELGAFESGMAAQLMGTVPSVVAGGVMTLVVVAVTALLVPELRRLTLAAAKVDTPSIDAQAS